MTITDRQFLAAAPNLTALIEEAEASTIAAAEAQFTQHTAYVAQMAQVLA